MDVSQEILELAQSLLHRVKPSGSQNIMASCPFHSSGEEKHPSFALSLTKGLYFCHACHEKGSLYTLLRHFGLTKDLIRIKYGLLLDAAGRNIPYREDPKKPREIWVTLDKAIDESLLGLFEHEITHLLPGFEPATLKHFDLGWDGWHYRITYPLYDLQGALVGISGRSVRVEDWPRYKLYDTEYKAWELPSRLNWDKRAILWNGWQVYPELFHSTPNQGYVVVVEGFKAAMWLWQAGVRNVVALLGSYLSWEQQWILERLGVPIYLFLDNDNAGRKGQLDAAARLNAKGCIVRIIEYPNRLKLNEDAQPDSLYEDEIRLQKAHAIYYAKWLLQDKTNGIR